MENDYGKYIQGTGRKDLTLLFADRDAFRDVVEKMAESFKTLSIDKVVGLDALGFVFVAPVAQELGVGFALLRKEGKVPVEKESISFVDYSNTIKKFEVACSALSPGDRVLLVDEWSETGAQMKAAVSLLEKVGAEVVGMTCFNIDQKVIDDPELKRYTLYSVI